MHETIICTGGARGAIRQTALMCCILSQLCVALQCGLHTVGTATASDSVPLLLTRLPSCLQTPVTSALVLSRQIHCVERRYVVDTNF